MTLTDFKPAIDFTFQIVGGVVATAIPIVVTWFLSRYLHIQAQSALGQRIVAIASNAAANGLSKAQSAADAHGQFDVKSAAIAAGVTYFNQAVSTKTLDAAKITVPVDSMIEGQLQKLMTPAVTAPVVVAASVPAPVAPTPPAPNLG